VGPRASLDSGKSRHTGIRSPDRPARSSVTIPTELPGRPTGYSHKYNFHASDFLAMNFSATDVLRVPKLQVTNLLIFTLFVCLFVCLPSTKPFQGLNK
jgi:hypothetical protein